MITIADYKKMDATAMAEAVKKGDLSPEQLFAEAMRLLNLLNPLLNTVNTVLETRGAEAAKTCSIGRPFSGVPFLIKDANHALKGAPMSYGSKLLKTVISDYNAEIVNRFIKAGLIIIGKTNTPEFKLAYTTEPEAFGPTRNPYNPEYSCGGSSGGSAAAVAARIVPMASATDEGGSIRVPASYCGLFGFKPSRGRTPVGPKFQEDWDGLSQSHVITVSVRDSAATLDAVCGIEPSSPYALGQPDSTFLDAVSESPGKLKIGYHAQPAFGRTTHPDCVKALENTCQLLRDLGHHVEKIDPGYSENDVAFYWCILMLKNMLELFEELILQFGFESFDRNMELSSKTLYHLSKRMTQNHFIKAKAGIKTISRTMENSLKTYDMLLTPTLGQPPIKIGTHHTFRRRLKMTILNLNAINWLLPKLSLFEFIIKQLIRDTMKAQMPYTMVANLTGQPAMSIPLYWSEQGLPIGTQFLGRYKDEMTLFRLAGQLEKARPWTNKIPECSSN